MINTLRQTCLQLMILMLGYVSLACQAQQVSQLPLDCYKVPLQPKEYCMVTTRSAYGPFDDAVFYLKDQGELQFLRSVSGQVATYGFIGFSVRGQYAVEAWAEEGHPIFMFYRSQQLLSPDAEPLLVFAKYPFAHVDQINDDGSAVVGSHEPFNAGQCDEVPKQLALEDPDNCHRVLRFK